ncbi:glycoside hydrolase family 95 protein [Aureibacillus halotolerans]|uniref:Alpha-L-fucosidase 2 n=1 Tax=Aureibacillus halotolerans TaxID=1508390 RepID=A0A4R6U8X2_9BACI|nr:glycoside hydrolase family 95 protein [Aureibacillus halotolerans]TDQ42861.1 alpha-L-fucosidase 2 [Aureibacillus halotolerans]
MRTTKLWYKHHAKNWNEALPIGNGRLGGMVFGEAAHEHIQLNEDSLWHGGPRDRNNPDALTHLPEIRRRIFNGELSKAEELASMALSGLPEAQRHYVPLGDLDIYYSLPEGNVSDYTRELDLVDGVARVQFNVGDTTFKREIFSSYTDQVLAIRLTATTPGALTFKTKLDRQQWRYVDRVRQESDDMIVMEGNAGGAHGCNYAMALQLVPEGGTLELIGEYAIVTGADSAVLLLSAGTSFRHAIPIEACLQTLYEASHFDGEMLYQRHKADYQALYSRVDLQFGESLGDLQGLDTEERLARVKAGHEDHELTALYFQFGRYLLISSSRPGSLPANLQGIWNKEFLPPWGSKFTVNINTQMNYWLAETCHLPECHLPLFEHLERMRTPGRITARKMYGARGFTSHHNTDIWADTAPQDTYLPASYWPMSSAWLCLHLWEHYQFTQDRTFLEKAFHTMKDAALFFIDFLVESPEGYLVTCPSVSPENTFILPNGESGVLCYGPTMDSQILHELFTACLSAGKILKAKDAILDEIAETLAKLPPTSIGKHGQIMEWVEDYEEKEPGHRHISHLFALHPGSAITPLKTPELAEAARVTLERRLASGGGHTGWSRAWIINFWARLHDSEKAYQNVQALLQKSTLPSLLDDHPPFQIDGNFGGTAGIAEMLLQSQNKEIHLLPALPKAWKRGYVKGIRARGGITIDISWENGVLVEATLQTDHDGYAVVRSADVTGVYQDGKGIPATKTSSDKIEFAIKSGGVYVLHP